MLWFIAFSGSHISVSHVVSTRRDTVVLHLWFVVFMSSGKSSDVWLQQAWNHPSDIFMVAVILLTVDVCHDELYSWIHQHCDSLIIMNAQRIFDGCFMTCSMIVLCLDYGTRNMSLSYLLVSINFNFTGYSPFTSSSVNMTCPVCSLNNVTWAFCTNVLQSLNVLTQIWWTLWRV